ncbi:MAG: response regulator transcription factor [Chloroflexi bacterium]|jgi:DNA-binding NarL/FixJ family response regulator|nr:response regulator transcription factor [Chloroflexota bacterium]
MKTIRVFIVDDHPLMRNALEMAIEAAFDMKIAGEAINGKEALHLIPRVETDVVLMDLMMPEMTGLEAIQALTNLLPDIRILVLSSLDKEADILQAVQLGALGFITKNAQRDELLQAIRTVGAGEAYLPPKIAAKLMNTVRESHSGKAHSGSEALTRRQRDVLALIGQGFTNQQIATTLHIADATVRVHISNMMDILGIEYRRELVVYAVRQHMES